MKTRVTTTMTATGGTGRATAGPPKAVRKEERRMRLRKARGKVTAPSDAGVTGISPVTALTGRPWAKEALKEEAKEERQETKEVKEVRQG